MTEPVKVAVLDDGVTSHEDLPASRILAGRDFADNDFNAQPGSFRAHGMACAGIIAAEHTTDSVGGLSSSSGVISLDAYVNILPVKIFTDLGQGGTSVTATEAINWAWQNGADILSNSWSFPALCPFPLDNVIDAINSATQLGRNGKGCVGATQLNDVRWYYSQYGSALDIVAPSGDFCLQGDVWSLDQMSSLGNNPNVTTKCDLPVVWDCPTVAQNDVDYNCNFGGTSAAAPVVSGVAALILSKADTLTALEVYDILRFSAVTELDSDTITPPDTAYGYGRVDAFRSILSISRGDLNNDNAIGNNLDLTFMVDRIFRGGPDPFPSPLMGDCNCDGTPNNVLDLTFLIDYIFRGSGIPPVNPCYKF